MVLQCLPKVHDFLETKERMSQLIFDSRLDVVDGDRR